MSKSYIKEIFQEQWDDYQLESVSFEVGGNKPFFEFLKGNFLNCKLCDFRLLDIESYYRRKI